LNSVESGRRIPNVTTHKCPLCKEELDNVENASCFEKEKLIICVVCSRFDPRLCRDIHTHAALGLCRTIRVMVLQPALFKSHVCLKDS
jgi:hypothetical protein